MSYRYKRKKSDHSCIQTPSTSMELSVDDKENESDSDSEFEPAPKRINDMTYDLSRKITPKKTRRSGHNSPDPSTCTDITSINDGELFGSELEGVRTRSITMKVLRSKERSRNDLRKLNLLTILGTPNDAVNDNLSETGGSECFRDCAISFAVSSIGVDDTFVNGVDDALVKDDVGDRMIENTPVIGMIEPVVEEVVWLPVAGVSACDKEIHHERIAEEKQTQIDDSENQSSAYENTSSEDEDEDETPAKWTTQSLWEDVFRSRAALKQYHMKEFAQVCSQTAKKALKDISSVKCNLEEEKVASQSMQGLVSDMKHLQRLLSDEKGNAAHIKTFHSIQKLFQIDKERRDKIKSCLESCKANLKAGEDLCKSFEERNKAYIVEAVKKLQVQLRARVKTHNNVQRASKRRFFKSAARLI